MSVDLDRQAFKKPPHTHLISLYLGGDSSVVDDLRWQEVELDVGMGDVWATTDETAALQVGCCSITYRMTITLRVGHCHVCQSRYVFLYLFFDHFGICY